jgi:hypothetical protein
MNRSLSYRYLLVLSLVAVATAIGLSVAARAATAATYTDATGDNYGGPEVDISNVVVTNDATNLYFQINLNTAANIGPTANRYANYEIGIKTGAAGGQTAINGTFGTGNPAAGNPYGNSVGISTGENFFIGSFLDGTSFSGGAELFSYTSLPTDWTKIGSTAPITEVYTGTPSTAFSFPLASLGLSAGNTFKFDVWTSFGSPQGAYDALDNTTGTPNSGGLAPYSGGAYDSATASGSVLASYTVAVPEPCSIVLAAIGGCGLLAFGARLRASQQ